MEVFPFRGVRLTSGLTCGFRVAYDDKVTLLLDREIQDFVTILLGYLQNFPLWTFIVCLYAAFRRYVEVHRIRLCC